MLNSIVGVNFVKSKNTLTNNVEPMLFSNSWRAQLLKTKSYSMTVSSQIIIFGEEMNL